MRTPPSGHDPTRAAGHWRSDAVDAIIVITVTILANKEIDFDLVSASSTIKPWPVPQRWRHVSPGRRWSGVRSCTANSGRLGLVVCGVVHGRMVLYIWQLWSFV